MARVLVRNLDDEIVDALKRKAKLRGCSLEQELRDILAEAARPTVEERLALSDRLRSLTLARPQSDSTELVREERDRR
jgi:antitoxin FitA